MSQSHLLKHVGQLSNTHKKIAVVFLQIPGRETHSLVVDTESLPDRYHQPLMELIQSPEARNAQNLGEVLARRYMPDTGKTMLETFHSQGLLQPVPIDNVILVPRPNQHYPLRQILEAMNKIIPQESEVVNEKPLNDTSEISENSERGFFTQNRDADRKESDLQVARGLLMQADLVESEVVNLRQRAYKIAPELKPQASRSNMTGPKKVLEESVESVASSLEEKAKPKSRAKKVQE